MKILNLNLFTASVGVLSIIFSSLIASAEPKGDAKRGAALYGTCAACHGAQGTGNQQLNSPAIAGQESWYLARQLKNLKAGIRGAHPKDTYGAQMRPMSMTLADDQAISDVIAHIQTFPAPPKEAKVPGDATAGKALYGTCTACHGPAAKGNKMMNAPSLLNLPSWYMARQLKHFKEGIRGAHPKDTYGAQMRGMSMTLADDKAIQNVVAYIKSL